MVCVAAIVVAVVHGVARRWPSTGRAGAATVCPDTSSFNGAAGVNLVARDAS